MRLHVTYPSARDRGCAVFVPPGGIVYRAVERAAHIYDIECIRRGSVLHTEVRNAESYADAVAETVWHLYDGSNEYVDGFPFPAEPNDPAWRAFVHGLAEEGSRRACRYASHVPGLPLVLRAFDRNIGRRRWALYPVGPGHAFAIAGDGTERHAYLTIRADRGEIVAIAGGTGTRATVPSPAPYTVGAITTALDNLGSE